MNFIQDLYLIAEYRDVTKPNMGMDFPLDIALPGNKKNIQAVG